MAEKSPKLDIELGVKGARKVEKALGKVEASVDELSDGLEEAGKQGESGSGFSKLSDKLTEMPGPLGDVGSKFSGLGNMLGAGGPVGVALAAAAAAFAAVGAAIGVSVAKVSGMEKELRPMVERSGLAAESLQVLTKAAERLGSEDGLEGVTDASQELQLRLAEVVQDGTGPAVAAFEKLGLSSEDLINKSPEESLLATITALQGVTNAADRKFLADELMGGASEKLSGIINATSEDFQALTADIAENAGILSNEGYESAQQYNLALTRWNDLVEKVMIAIGEFFLPILTDLINVTVDSAQAVGNWMGAIGRAIGIVKDTGDAVDNTSDSVQRLGSETDKSREGMEGQTKALDDAAGSTKRFTGETDRNREGVEGQTKALDDAAGSTKRFTGETENQRSALRKTTEEIEKEEDALLKLADTAAAVAARMTDIIEDSRAKMAALQVRYAQRVESRERRLGQRIADIHQSHNESLVDLRRDWAQEDSDLHEDHARDLRRMAEYFAESREEIQRDLNATIADLNEDFRRSELDREQELVDRLAEIHRDVTNDTEEAELNLVRRQEDIDRDLS